MLRDCNVITFFDGFQQFRKTLARFRHGVFPHILNVQNFCTLRFWSRISLTNRRLPGPVYGQDATGIFCTAYGSCVHCINIL